MLNDKPTINERGRRKIGEGLRAHFDADTAAPNLTLEDLARRADAAVANLPRCYTREDGVHCPVLGCNCRRCQDAVTGKGVDFAALRQRKAAACGRTV